MGIEPLSLRPTMGLPAGVTGANCAGDAGHVFRWSCVNFALIETVIHLNVGIARFERAIFCSQSRRLNQVWPYPVWCRDRLPCLPRRFNVFDSRIRTCNLRCLKTDAQPTELYRDCTAHTGKRLKQQVILNACRVAITLRRYGLEAAPRFELGSASAQPAADRSGVSADNASAWSENLSCPLTRLHHGSELQPELVLAPAKPGSLWAGQVAEHCTDVEGFHFHHVGALPCVFHCVTQPLVPILQPLHLCGRHGT